jgi:hypothetical protein
MPIIVPEPTDTQHPKLSASQEIHGHFSAGSTPAAMRVVCPDCGRFTAVNLYRFTLWPHDRLNLNTRVRELCPGTYWNIDAERYDRRVPWGTY